MTEDIIGIEVQGEIHAIKDESASTKTDLNEVKYKGKRTPLFTLEKIQPVALGRTPTDSNPIVIAGTGALTPTSSNFRNFNCSLQFFSDCIAIVGVTVIILGTIPSEWTNLGTADFGILFSNLKTLLKNKYAGREAEIDNYMDNVATTFVHPTYGKDKESIVLIGEPGAACVTTQNFQRGSTTPTGFTFKYSCGNVIKIKEPGPFTGLIHTYDSFLTVKEIPS